MSMRNPLWWLNVMLPFCIIAAACFVLTKVKTELFGGHEWSCEEVMAATAVMRILELEWKMRKTEAAKEPTP